MKQKQYLIACDQQCEDTLYFIAPGITTANDEYAASFAELAGEIVAAQARAREGRNWKLTPRPEPRRACAPVLISAAVALAVIATVVGAVLGG